MTTARGRQPTILPSTPAWEAFAAALADTVTPCRRHPEWTSDEAEDRAVAARACRSCALVELCHAAAVSTDEVHGVWGGIDRTRKQRERKSA